jgi:GcrA cell cycle regulator
MACHTETSDPLVAAMLDALGLTQHRIARLFNVSARHIRRWRSGARRVPHAVGIVCNLLAVGAVTIEQVEAAVPARTNGGVTRPEPPAPRVEPEPELATRANPGSTITEEILALDRDTCRWPSGTPGRSDFHFCGRPIAKGSYCQQHHSMAHIAQPLRPGFRPSASLASPVGVHECVS